MNLLIYEFRDSLKATRAVRFLLEREPKMKEVLSQVKSLAAGDLVLVEWCDDFKD